MSRPITVWSGPRSLYARQIAAIASIVLLLGIFLDALAQAEELPAVTLAMDPASIVVGSEATAGSGLVIVTTADGRSLPDMTLRSRPAKAGEHLAFIRFPNNHNKDWILLPSQSAGRAEVQIEVVDVVASGVYEGLIEAAISGRQNVAATAKVAVYRIDSNFAPVFGGEIVKNNRVEFTTSSGREFVFSVQNPSTGWERVFTLELVPRTGTTAQQQKDAGTGNPHESPALSFNPPTFRLRPGQEQAVVARVWDRLLSGSSFHVIKLSDGNTPTLSKNMVVALKVPESPLGWPAWITLGLVLLGAVFSLLLNNFFPPSLAKRRNFQLLDDSSAFIRNCTNASPFVQSALLAENSQIRLLNERIQPLAPTAAQLGEIDRLIKSLEEKQQIAHRINNLRDDIQRNAALPARTIVVLEEILLEAGDSLIDGEVEKAKAMLEDANHQRTTGLSETALKQLRNDWGKDIDALRKRLEGVEGASSNPFISDLVQKLTASQQSIATLPGPELQTLERQYHAVAIYTEFQEAGKRNQKFKALEPQLIRLLQSNSASSEVSHLRSLLKHNIALSDIEEALQKQKFSLNWDPKLVHAYELASFWFEFKDLHLQLVPAAMRVLSYEWDFQDGISSPSYDSIKHHFEDTPDESSITASATEDDHCSPQTPCAPGGEGLLPRPEAAGVADVMIDTPRDQQAITAQRPKAPASPSNRTPWPWSWRKLSIPYKVTVTLKVKSRFSLDGVEASQQEKITIQKPASCGGGTLWMQLISFGVSSILAVLLAFSTQYTVIPELNSFVAYLTPMLWGFSLDQIRDKATR